MGLGDFGFSSLYGNLNPNLNNGFITSIASNVNSLLTPVRVVSIVLNEKSEKFKDWGEWNALGAIQYEVVDNPLSFNPNFVYEISCDQMCGNGHYSMKGVIEVVDQEEYDLWIAKQKPQYFTAFPEEAAKLGDGQANPVVVKADSTAKAATTKM